MPGAVLQGHAFGLFPIAPAMGIPIGTTLTAIGDGAKVGLRGGVIMASSRLPDAFTLPIIGAYGFAYLKRPGRRAENQHRRESAEKEPQGAHLQETPLIRGDVSPPSYKF